MDEQQLIELGQRLEDAFNTSDWATYSSAMTNNTVLDSPRVQARGPEEIIQYVRGVKEALPRHQGNRHQRPGLREHSSERAHLGRHSRRADEDATGDDSADQPADHLQGGRAAGGLERRQGSRLPGVLRPSGNNGAAWHRCSGAGSDFVRTA